MLFCEMTTFYSHLTKGMARRKIFLPFPPFSSNYFPSFKCSGNRANWSNCLKVWKDMKSLRRFHCGCNCQIVRSLLFKHFKPQDPHTNSPHWPPYTSSYTSTQLREFALRSKCSPFGNQLSNSHNLYSWWSADVVRRKLMLVTFGT